MQGETEQRRENLKSCVVLTARLDNRDLGSAITEIQQQLNSKLALPKGYAIDYGGAYSEQQQSFQELLLILLMASLFVFGVFMFYLRNGCCLYYCFSFQLWEFVEVSFSLFIQYSFKCKQLY